MSSASDGGAVRAGAPIDGVSGRGSDRDPTDTRTLCRLALPARLHDPGPGAALALGLVVDCETTGADAARDAVAEAALLPFTFTPEGRVAEVLHGEAQAHRRGGAPFDAAAAGALIARARLLVAHNARFDRPFFERLLPQTRDKPWACSRLEVPWRAAGAPSDALHCLLCHFGVFARARHRALADCEAALWLLARALPGTGRTALAALIETSAAETVRLWVLDAPFAVRGALRARGYHWSPAPRDGLPRGWWTELAPERIEAERAWLAELVHGPYDPAWGGAPEPPRTALRRVSARERWRADPADGRAPHRGPYAPAASRHGREGLLSRPDTDPIGRRHR